MGLHIHIRGLLRSRVFLVTAITLLGLGLGVNLILFNTVYALLWRPLAFPNAGRLVTLRGRSATGDLTRQVTGTDGAVLHRESAVVAATGMVRRGHLVTLWDGSDSLDLTAGAVNAQYFMALGLRPLRGRFFGPGEDQGENAGQAAILTESAWRGRFGADPGVVGRVFPLQDGAERRPVRIVGIVPSTSTLPFAADADMLLPLPFLSERIRKNFGDALYGSVLRLRPGITMAEASARIDSALKAEAASLSRDAWVWKSHWVEPLRVALAPVDRRIVLLVYGSACLLLLLTCANLASLFTARALARSHETSVHLALGASRWRLLGGAFQEALLVGLGGTALAFLAESWTRPLIPKLVPQLRAIGPELMSPGPVLLVFAAGMCIVVALAVALASSARIETRGLAAALAPGGRTVSPRAGRIRGSLAAAQLAIVLTLLTVATLTGRSFLSAIRTDPGFQPEAVATFQVSLPGAQSGSVAPLVDFWRAIAATPGVTSAGFAAEPPVGAHSFGTVTATRPGEFVNIDPMISYRVIGPGYFETLGARLVTGRSVNEEDVAQGRMVVVVNQSAARLLFRGEQPVGRHVHSGFQDRWSEVVGVVQDIRTEGLDQPSAPMVYMPYVTLLTPRPRFLVRGTGDPARLAAALKTRARAWNSAVVLQRFEALRDTLEATVRERVLAGWVVGGFALLGLLISSVGLYGTMAAQVQSRRREIGIRIALGASAGSVVGNVLAGGLRIVGAGAAAGLAASTLAASLVRPHLFGVRALDPVSFALALALLAAAALAACLLPAMKAARLDPMRTLNVQ